MWGCPTVLSWWIWGERRLRILSEPVRVFQVRHSDLRAEFRRCGRADAVATNLPTVETPALAEADRHLLLSTLHSAGERIRSRGAAEQLLHGEPHPGNLLSTRDGLLFIDFETCCRGPIEFDVAHVPAEVSARYPDVDQVLLAQCLRLVLAMVAAWRWDIRDEFPDGHQHGRDILCLLRQGPPWPALGTLAAE